jgi:RimJ/RimL family protein N-acetyltransferase
MGKLRVGTLTGQHVVLERLRVDHRDEIVKAGTGDRATFGLTQVPSNRDEAARYISLLLDDAENGRAAPFVQRQVVDGEIDSSVLVGCTRFMNPYWWLGRIDPDEVEIGGTWLNTIAQRTPLNTEAKILMLTHAFDTWHVQRVAICTDAENSRSRRAIERIGASFEGVLRRHRRSLQHDFGKSLRDSAMYSITIEDWPDVRAHLESLANR